MSTEQIERSAYTVRYVHEVQEKVAARDRLIIKLQRERNALAWAIVAHREAIQSDPQLFRRDPDEQLWEAIR